MDKHISCRDLSFWSEHQGFRNNRCSGYALAAILKDLGQNRFFQFKTSYKIPLGHIIYNQLQASQRIYLRKSPNSVCAQFINNPVNMQKNTHHILPSVIVTYCQSIHLSPILYYSQEKEESIFRSEILKEDLSRLTNSRCQQILSDDFKQQTYKHKYLLALTRYQHWVALKQENGYFYLFDPAPPKLGGGTTGPCIFENALPSEKYIKKGSYSTKYFYEIMIGLY